MITKCLFPVAGYGTRFLPATKAMPKEILPILDKPLVQYGVEEALAAGLTNIGFVTGRGKRAIEDHFDVSYELEHQIAGTSLPYYKKQPRSRRAKPAKTDRSRAVGRVEAQFLPRMSLTE